MTKANTTTPRLTAQRKLDLYRATRAADAPLGELLRQAGVHLDDLREIEHTVESAALAALKVKGRHGRLPSDVPPERMLPREQELREKTTALAELSVAYTLLEKKSASSCRPHPRRTGRAGDAANDPDLGGQRHRRRLEPPTRL